MCNLTLIQKFNDWNKFQSQFWVFFVRLASFSYCSTKKGKQKSNDVTEKNRRFPFFLSFVQCRRSTTSERGPQHDATTAVLVSWHCVRRFNTSTHSTGACNLRFLSVFLLIRIFVSFKKHLARPCRQLQIVSSSRSKELLSFLVAVDIGASSAPHSSW